MQQATTQSLEPGTTEQPPRSRVETTLPPQRRLGAGSGAVRVLAPVAKQHAGFDGVASKNTEGRRGRRRWHGFRVPPAVFALLGATGVSVYCALVIHPRSLVVAGVSCLVLFLGSVVPWLSVRRVRCEVGYSRRRGQIGRPLSVRLRLRGGWPWPVYGLVVRCGWTDGSTRESDPARLAVSRLPGGREAELTGHLVPSRRGVFPCGKASISSGFPFGFWEPSRRIRVAGQVLVWPEIVPLKAPRDGVCRYGYGDLTNMHRQGTVGEFRGTRPYQPGESLRKVHWRQTARHDRLIVCERSAPARRGVVLLVETDPGVHDRFAEGDTLERVLSVGASLASAMVQSGLRVALAFERGRVFEAESAAELAAAFDAMARFDSRRGASLAELREAVFRRRSTAGEQFVVTTAKGHRHASSRKTGAEGGQLLVVDPESGAPSKPTGAIPAGPHWKMHVVPLDDPDHRGLRRAWQEVLRGR